MLRHRPQGISSESESGYDDIECNSDVSRPPARGSSRHSLLSGLSTPVPDARRAASALPLLAIRSPATPNIQQIRQSIDAFLVSLPLGTDRQAADVEAQVAARLLDSEVARAALQDRLQQWVEVAQGLHAMAAQQRTQIDNLQQQQQQEQLRRQSPMASAADDAFNRDTAATNLRSLQDEVKVLRRQLCLYEASAVPWQPPPSAALSSGGAALQSGPVAHELRRLKAENQDLQDRLAFCERRLEQQGTTAQRDFALKVVDHYQSAAALRGELSLARAQLAERAEEVQRCAEEQQRLRRALLDAEIEMQHMTLAGDVVKAELKASRVEGGRLAQELARSAGSQPTPLAASS